MNNRLLPASILSFPSFLLSMQAIKLDDIIWDNIVPIVPSHLPIILLASVAVSPVVVVA